MQALRSEVRTAVRRAAYRAWLLRTHPGARDALRGRALHPYRARQFGAFGAGSYVHRPTWLYGTHQMSVGTGVRVMAGAWLSVEPEAWALPGPVLVLGDGVAIRVGVSVSAAASVVVEDDVTMGAYVSIVDSNHTWGTAASVMDAPVAAEPVRIGRGTWLGDKVTVLAGSDIGARCLVGANAVVRGTVPDGSVVVGNPGRVVGTTDGR